jgi:autotransporter-associated beta strand protein
VSAIGGKAMGQTWTGAVNNTWDTTTANWDSGTYTNGGDATFADIQSQSDNSYLNFNITVTPGGISADQVTFANSSSTYNLTGGSVSTNASYNSKIFYVVGGGTVNLSNITTNFYRYQIVSGTLNAGPNTILGGIYISAGNSNLLENYVDVFSGATLTLDQGVQLPAAANAGLFLGDAGTIEVKPGANIQTNLGNQLSNGTAANGILQLDAGATFTATAGTFRGSVTSGGSGAGTLVLSSVTSIGMASAAVESEAFYIDSASNLASGVNLAVNGGGLVSVGENSSSHSYPNVAAGSGVNISVSGTGYAASTSSCPDGAVRGSDSGTDTWLGTITVPSSGSISGGSGGTLTLAGAISGGTVAFSTDYNSTTILGAVNTYTGETQIGAPYLTAGTLQLGVANAINASSGLSFAGGGAGTFDLHGYSTSVAYLTTRAASPAQGTYYYTNGSGSIVSIVSPSSSTITNTGNSSATLNVIQAAGSMTYAGTITDGSSAKTALTFSGSGNQVLTGNNTFTGGTTLFSGTVTAGSATALGLGLIVLAGGKLSLATTTGTTAISSLTTPAFTVNAASSSYYPPSISGGTFNVTDNGSAGEANSAFAPVTLGAKGFLASFNYKPTFAYGTTTPAGGITFTLQSNGATALGGSGFGLGYSGINNSLAVEFATLPFNNTAGSVSTFGNLLGTTLKTNGASTNPYTDFDNANGMQLNSEEMNISLLYDATAQTLTEMISSGQIIQPKGQSSPSDVTAYYSHTYTGVNLASILGAGQAYAGFTGGTTTTTGFAQSISNFVFTNYTRTTTPTLLTNNLNASTGTSTIQLGISSGHLNGSVGTVAIASGAAVAITSLASDSIPLHGVLTTTGVSLSGSTNAWTGKLDLTNNSLDVQNGSIATLTNQVKQGYANGTWNNSSGIVSSSAAADTTHRTALGVILNTTDGTPTGAQLYGTATTQGLFSGISPAKTDVLIKDTYYGDTNLDGKIDGTDYSRIDAAYLSHGALTGWFNGDFNYDGVINGSDYTLIDNAFNTEGAQLSALIAAPTAIATAQIAENSAVPEPSAFGLLGLSICGLIGRRRHRSSLETTRASEGAERHAGCIALRLARRRASCLVKSG